MEREAYKEEIYRDHTIKIYYESCPESPRDWCHLGTIYSNHRRYDPDGHLIEEIMNDEKAGLSEEFKRDYIWLNIYAYIHGGISLSTGTFNDPWDSGLFGIIAVSKEKAIKEYGKKICTKKIRERVLHYLEGEIELLDDYYNGRVFGYVVEDSEGEEIDSCWGYYGDSGIEDAIGEAKSIIDYQIERAEQLHAERMATLKDKISSLIGRTFIHLSTLYRVGKDMFGFPVLEMAKSHKGMVLGYDDIKLQDLPEDVLSDMVNAIA